MDFRSFPSLSPEEFTECCHLFEALYCRASLGPLRRRWKLTSVSALDVSGFGPGGYVTYIQISRPLEVATDAGGLAGIIEKLGMAWNDEREGILDQQMEMDEMNDAAVVRLDPPEDDENAFYDAGKVTYEIHLHPTYRVPCLWFSMENLPVDEHALDVDTVFRRLVPDQFKNGLRALGHMGGISMDHHPITGVPTFFIHPCLLGDAMNGFAEKCTRENYLMLWLGLVGGCVGLWVPKEMAQAKA
ncbi:hypothetical protein TD95_004831 [Thielaviopsis punctulata]|uniref:Ubiquitin-like-conjugating enzyme ATG10 n=1 Tax=Thielaviopsis punctulata TaxID=72032 RepID=A0A0F4Z729_9PEZI|nr:hypothetical protein TD95_004831 [Thielaviopsis punctulata]